MYNSSYYKNLCLEKDDFDYLLDFAIRQGKKSIIKIKSGEVTAYPICEGGKRTCEYCSFKSLCGYEGNNDNIVVDVVSIESLKEIGEDSGKV